MRTETKTYLLGGRYRIPGCSAAFMIRHGKLPGGFVETFLAQAFK